jgi:predicted GH43/DUF377 family glycosyl hydrolase
VAEGNFSRIGRARVDFDRAGDPRRVERLGVILEPKTPYELSQLGGGVEDPRVNYLAPLGLYVMTYTAYMAPRPRIALAVSSDLIAWHRLGPLQYATYPDEPDLNTVNNKDGLIFPDAVPDLQGRPSIAIIHRPMLPAAPNTPNDTPTETIWLSYASLEAASTDPQHLTQVQGHRMLMASEADWEALKVGGGAPPVRLPYGWLLLYHGVSQQQSAQGLHRVYSAGAAILAPDDPGRVLAHPGAGGALRDAGYRAARGFPDRHRPARGRTHRRVLWSGRRDDRRGAPHGARAVAAPAVIPGGGDR